MKILKRNTVRINQNDSQGNTFTNKFFLLNDLFQSNDHFQSNTKNIKTKFSLITNNYINQQITQVL